MTKYIIPMDGRIGKLFTDKAISGMSNHKVKKFHLSIIQKDQHRPIDLILRAQYFFDTNKILHY